MTETVDIVTFLRARLDEDEQVARAAAGRSPGVWEARLHPGPPISVWSAGESPAVLQVSGTWVEPGAHIARHDPARVLADVVARRAILAQHHRVEWSGPAGCGTCSTEGVELVLWPCLTVRALAVPYAGHPDHYSGWGLDGTS